MFGDGGELLDGEHLAAQLVVDPGGGERLLGPGGGAAQPASAARRVLRRWANAASTTANTCSRLAVVLGGSWRTSETSPESTLGAGQKTLRPIAPARFTSAYQLALTEGTP